MIEESGHVEEAYLDSETMHGGMRLSSGLSNRALTIWTYCPSRYRPFAKWFAEWKEGR